MLLLCVDISRLTGHRSVIVCSAVSCNSTFQFHFTSLQMTLQASRSLFSGACELFLFTVNERQRGQPSLADERGVLKSKLALRCTAEEMICQTACFFFSESPYLCGSTCWNGVTRRTVGSSITLLGTTCTTRSWCSWQTQVGHSSLVWGHPIPV